MNTEDVKNLTRELNERMVEIKIAMTENKDAAKQLIEDYIHFIEENKDTFIYHYINDEGFIKDNKERIQNESSSFKIWRDIITIIAENVDDIFKYFDRDFLFKEVNDYRYILSNFNGGGDAKLNVLRNLKKESDFEYIKVLDSLFSFKESIIFVLKNLEVKDIARYFYGRALNRDRVLEVRSVDGTVRYIKAKPKQTKVDIFDIVKAAESLTCEVEKFLTDKVYYAKMNPDNQGRIKKIRNNLTKLRRELSLKIESAKIVAKKMTQDVNE